MAPFSSSDFESELRYDSRSSYKLSFLPRKFSHSVSNRAILCIRSSLEHFHLDISDSSSISLAERFVAAEEDTCMIFAWSKSVSRFRERHSSWSFCFSCSRAVTRCLRIALEDWNRPFSERRSSLSHFDVAIVSCKAEFDDLSWFRISI